MGLKQKTASIGLIYTMKIYNYQKQYTDRPRVFLWYVFYFGILFVLWDAFFNYAKISLDLLYLVLGY